MYCKGLPTPRNIQVLNDKSYPGLYPGYLCPICKEGMGEDFHIFCQCSALQGTRTQAAQDCTRAINKIVGGNFLRVDEIRPGFFPPSKDRFKHGQVHMEIKRKLEEASIRSPDRFAAAIGSEVATMYHKIWSRYTDVMAESKLTLNDRLRELYGKTTAEIRRTWDNG